MRLALAMLVTVSVGCGRFGFDAEPTEVVGDLCTDESDCDDGLVCNGLERCSPDATTGELRCEPGTAVVCPAGRACTEATRGCATDCDLNPDVDGDGAPAVECGGSDCDDGQSGIRPGATELCDGRDEDCDGVVDEAPAMCSAASIAADSGTACTIVSGGAVLCWGTNRDGELGDGSFDHGRCGAPPRDCSRAPVGALLPGTATGLDVGNDHACAVVGDAVYCWGDNGSGQLGSAAAEARTATPLPVDDLPPAQSVSAGDLHTCASTTGGEVYCWGAGDLGELGDGLFTDSTRPRRVPLVDAATRVGAGGSTTCAATATEVYCWGSNSDSELNDGTTDNRAAPVLSLAAVVDDLSVGSDHVCVVSAGSVVCWGGSDNDAIGDGPAPGPVTTSLAMPFVAVSAGVAHTCAIDAGGSLHCWGDGNSGELGPGASRDSAVPVLVTGIANASSVAAGNEFSCAVDGGKVLCWGRNERGQLGDGTNDTRPEPAPVQGL